MKKQKTNWKTIIIAVVLAMVGAYIIAPKTVTIEKEESVYDRVMRTGKIRCGYFNWYPAYIEDHKTGEVKGIAYEAMNEMGKNLNLDIEWAEEIPLADYSAAVSSGRVDAICAVIWATSQRARSIDYADPFLYLPLYAYSRKGDTRFDNYISIANNPKYTVAVLEGGATESIQRQVLPNATVITLPSLTSPSDLFLTLETGKADLVIYDSFTFGKYNDRNPGKLRKIPVPPLKIFPVTMGIKQGEDKFRRMINHALTELEITGTLDEIIKKHEIYPNAFRYRSKPYEEK